MSIVQAAPNVVATLNGHDHWDEVNTLEGITHIQNAAFVEWPNSYRVFRVYADRMEWEVRQVSNRGYIRESFLPGEGRVVDDRHARHGPERRNQPAHPLISSYQLSALRPAARSRGPRSEAGASGFSDPARRAGRPPPY